MLLQNYNMQSRRRFALSRRRFTFIRMFIRMFPRRCESCFGSAIFIRNLDIFLPAFVCQVRQGVHKSSFACTRRVHQNGAQQQQEWRVRPRASLVVARKVATGDSNLEQWTLLLLRNRTKRWHDVWPAVAY